MSSSGSQLHHLIPNELKDHPVLVRLRNSSVGYNQDSEARNLIFLPDKKSAASTLQVALAADPDAVHQGSHAAYTKMVRELLKGIQDEFFGVSGTLNQGKTFQELDDVINRIQFFLADGLTASFDGTRTQGPKFILNNADPRGPGDFSQDDYYNFLFKDYSDYDTIKSQDLFSNALKLRPHIDFNYMPEDFDDGAKGKSGLWAVIQKIEGAKKAGLSTYDGVDVSGIDVADLEKLKLNTSSSKLNALKNIFSTYNKNTLSDDLGKIDAVMVGALAIGLYQIASDSEMTVEELLAEIDFEIPPEMLLDAGWSMMLLAAETVILGIFTGGVGSVIRLGLVAIDVMDSVELLTLTVNVLDVAYPEWELIDTLSESSETIISIAGTAIRYIATAVGFSEIIIADTSEISEVVEDILSVNGSNDSDLVWVHGGGEVNVDTGAGDDWIFDIGEGKINAGDGSDFVFAYNPTEPDNPLTYGQERQQLTIDMGAGDDWVIGLGAADINLGQGEDWLIAAGVGSVVYTGPGGIEDRDTINMIYSRGALMADVDAYDKVAMYGFVDLAGSYVKHRDSESKYTYGLFGAIKLGINSDGELVVGDLFSVDGEGTSFMYVANYNNDLNAASSELTAGVRMGEFWLNIWRTADGGPGADDDLSGRQAIWDFITYAIKDLSFRATAGQIDPLVFDLDGDGLELTSMVTGVSPMFDMDGDGFAEHTGWVAPDDGILVVDADGNGSIDCVDEMFGGAGVSGFEELATHDENEDGVIDANDAIYSELRIWQDLNGNAVTDDGELFSLADLNIASIDLTATEDGSENALNLVDRTGNFTYSDGSTGTVGDVTFRINNYDTVYTGDTTISPEVAAAMPALKGHGTLADLQVSVTLGGIDGALAQTIESVLPTLNVVDLDVLSERAFEILTAWTEADPNLPLIGNYADVPALIGRDGEIDVRDFAYQVTETITHQDGTEETITYWQRAGGTSIREENGAIIQYPSLEQLLAHDTGVAGLGWEMVSAETLAFMERYFGEEIPINDIEDFTGSSVTGFKNLLEKTERLVDQLSLRLAMQGGLEEYFDGVEYSVEDDKFRPTTDFELIPFFKKIFEAAPGDASAADAWLDAWKPLVDALLSDYERPGAGRITEPFIFTNVVAAYETIGLPISLADATESLGVSKDIVDYGSGDRTGSGSNEIYYMGAGDDVVESKAGNDVFVFGENFGQDVINDFETMSDDFDTIRFAHLTPDDILATRDGKDLVLTVEATGDSVRVIGQFHDINFSSFGGSTGPHQGIEEIVFANGKVWGLGEIADAVSHPLDSDDTLIGTDHFDVLDGGLGDDFLQGGNNFDIYKFDAGYGQDIIQDRQMNVASIGHDVVTFGDGLTRSDLSFSREGDSNDLVITTTGGDTLTVKGQFWGGMALGSEIWIDRIEYFQFEKADGENLGFDYAEVMRALVAEAKTDGGDVIYGFTHDDILDGGAGNDTLIGGNKNDTYLFGYGYGADVFDEGGTNIDVNFESIDKVKLAAGITEADVTLERIEDCNDLIVKLSDGSQFTIERQFLGDNLAGNHYYAIETIEFDDGTVWDQEAIYAKLLASTEGDDSLYGFWRDDVLDGGAGNDYLNGGDGNDTYLFGFGYGEDTIYDKFVSVFTNDHDRLLFGEGVTEADVTWSREDDSNALVATLSDGSKLTIQSQFAYNNFGHRNFDIEHFEFADGHEISIWDIQETLLQATDGDDVLYGFASEDVFDGGAGNDTYFGGEYADTYHFGYGYGHDRIVDYAPSALIGGNDRIVFGEGIETSEVQVAWSGGNGLDLTLTVSTGESITIDGYRSEIYSSTFNGVEEVHFADGTVWTTSNLMAKIVESYVSNDDDTVIGFGDLGGEIRSGAGDDEIYGFNGDNTYVGGAGNDVITGGTGNDIYHYELGDGSDVIKERWGFGNDTLVFGASIEASDIEILRSFADVEDVTLKLADGSEIRLDDQVQTFNEAGIETIVFADGTTWTAADLRQKYEQAHLTDGDDVFIGFTTNDSIDGGDGDDELHGSHGGDTLIGGGGNDHLIGGRDGDTYVFTRGDGVDLVDDQGSVNQADKLVLHGYEPSEIVVSQSSDGNDIVLTFIGTDDRITLKDNAITANGNQIEQVEFDNGTIWEIAYVRDLMDGQVNTDGDDVFWGSNGNDTLSGGLGNDLLKGGAGADTYVYVRGDGHDRISEYQSGNGDLDKLVLTGVASNAVNISKSGDTVILTIAESTVGAGDAGSITLDNTLHSVEGAGVEEIHFDDGTIWTGQDLRAALVSHAGTDAGETLTGSSSGDILSGGLGDDLLEGGNGGDTYLYARGDGNDTIDEARLATGEDILHLEGILPGEVTLERDGNDVRLHIAESSAGAGDAGVILLDDNLDEDFGEGVEQVIFTDGTVWTRSDLRKQLLAAATTAEDDIINGFNSADSIVGGQGNDQLAGGNGGDTYIYLRGDGDDTIEEARSNTGVDTLRLDDVGPDEVTLERNGNDVRVVIAESAPGAADGGSVLLNQSLDEDFDEGVEQVLFADGTVWTRVDLRIKLLNSALTDGDDVVTAFNTDDVLEGGTGDDQLLGENGGDTYVYTRGDGHDTIIEERSHYGTDRLTLTDINPDVVTLEREGNNLRLVIAESSEGAGDGGSVLIDETLDADFDQGIEEILFADGTVWTRSDLRVMLIEAAQTSGDDTVIGFNTADTIEGGAGDDLLNGASGADTYIYHRGDGNDTIVDARLGTGDDVLRLEDILSFEVSLERLGNDLRLTIAETAEGAGDGGSILLVESLDADYDEGLEQIVFADGETWTRGDLREMLIAAAQTDGDDAITGFNVADVLEGGLGDDVLTGGFGSDTYIFNRGDGYDTIDDNGSFSTDVLFIKGYLPEELILSRNSANDDLVVTFAGTDDCVVILNTLGGSFTDTIEQIAFEDGTVWESAEISARTGLNDPLSVVDDAINVTADGQPITIAIADLLSNDVDPEGQPISLVSVSTEAADTQVELDGAGNVVVTPPVGFTGELLLTYTATDGIYTDQGIVTVIVAEETEVPSDDTINGTSGDDVIFGMMGDDTLDGKGGNDTYIYRFGDGNDVITEAYHKGTADRLELGVGILASEVALSRFENDLYDIKLTFADGGSILLNQQYHAPYGWTGGGVEQIIFDDGTIWNHDSLKLDYIAQVTSAGDDTILGFAGADVFNAGTGDDFINGWDGNDTYYYQLGDGHDTIKETYNNGSADRLELGAGILAAEVGIRMSESDADDITLVFADGGTITLDEQFYDSYSRKESGVEQIVFDDGTVWTHADLLSMTTAGTANDDTLIGGSGNDTLNGGDGNDVLDGGAGDDAHFGGAGDDFIIGNGGADTFDGGDGVDTLEFTYASSDIDFDLAAGLVTFTNGDQESIVNFENLIAGSGDNEIIGTSGTNNLSGGAGNDVINGGSGNDTLTGGSGSDTFVFMDASGDDVITDFVAGSGAGDIIEFASILFADFASLLAAASDNGTDTKIVIGANASLMLTDVLTNDLHQLDFNIV